MTSRTVFAVFITPIFLLLGLCYSLYTPLWSPPDEELHFAYCEYIARNHSIPQLTSNIDQARISQAFHPPLYYLIGSLFCSKQDKPIQELLTVNDGPSYEIIKHPAGGTVTARSAYLLRIFSLFLSLITIYCIYRLMLSVFPAETVLATAAALFVATNPQFLHISASVSNETLAATLSTIYIFSLVRYCKHTVTVPYSIVMGLVLGCGLLSKTSVIFLIPITVGVILFYQFRDMKRFLIDCMVVFGSALLTAGWWYKANWFMLTNMQTSQPWFARSTSLSVEYLKMMLGYTFMSFFGYFGALQIPIKPLHFLVYGAMLLLGTIGLCRLVLRRSLNNFQYQVLAILCVAFLGGLGVFISLNLKYCAFLGKYLFVVMAPIASIIFIGLRTLIPANWRRQAFVLLSLLLIAVNFDVFFRVLKPAYAEPRLIEGIRQPQFCCLSDRIDCSKTIAQTFTAPENNLCAIRVMLSCTEKWAQGGAVVTLHEIKPEEKLLYQIPLPLNDIDLASRHYVTFPPIRNSNSRKYRFSITLLPGCKNHGIAAWFEKGNVYNGGFMMEDGKTLQGALCFSAYFLNGESPYSHWEGTRAAVISQLYIPVKELQFYYECAPEVRTKTVTHEKAVRFEKALKNIKASSTKKSG